MVTSTRDFVTAVDEKNIIVVKELEPNDGHDGTGEDCREYVYAPERRWRRRYSDSIRNQLSVISKKFQNPIKKPRLALDVGKIFFE